MDRRRAGSRNQQLPCSVKTPQGRQKNVNTNARILYPRRGVLVLLDQSNSVAHGLTGRDAL